MRLPASGKSLQGLKIMADISRQEILVRGKPTEFLSIGKSLNEDPKKILLIIPGNPGVVSYYREFMQHLYDGVRDTHSVWAVSHAGHSHTPSLSFWPSNQHVYDLEEQVLHKMAFIMDHVPKGAQITLIGHSIGSYIILRLLKAMEAHSEINIEKNYLLFPTIERMKVSPNGEKLWPWLSYFRWLVIFFTVLAYILPVTVKQTILKLYFSRKEISEGSLKATIEIILLCFFSFAAAQSDILKWCTISEPEQSKCNSMSEALSRYFFESRIQKDRFKINCVQAFSKAECMQYLDSNVVDVTSMDPGDIYIGGRYHSLLPIAQEMSNGSFQGAYAVAVIKRDSMPDVKSLKDLRGKRACFGSVGLYGSWVLPIQMLMKTGALKNVDCNNHVKSATEFFGDSCAPNSLNDLYNPLGDNSNGLCRLCIGAIPGERCSSQDPYAGYQGAFRCLVEVGEIAFLKHTSVRRMVNNPMFKELREEQFQLLCPDGSRRLPREFLECNWGRIPNDAIMTSSAKTIEERQKYQAQLETLLEQFGRTVPEQISPSRNFIQDPFNLFESVPRYGNQHNLIFQDDTVAFRRILGNSQTYGDYLQDALQPIFDIRSCPVSRLRFCTTSEIAHNKCVKMKIALKAQLLQPELLCIRGHSDVHCMKLIESYEADATMLDAGDVYTAGNKYNLIPILSEVYNLGEPEYYVVAVAKARDAATELIYLKGKNTCHTGYNHAAGWIVPMAHLLTNQQIRNYGCNSMQAAAEFFSKSCLPGALSREYATSDLSYTHLCDLCRGSSYKFCRRDLSEDYFGHTGAFRCLVEGGGQVAFVKHTTVAENCDGKRREFWSRNQLSRDYELLCRDGQRAPVTDYRSCNLGKVKANALVTRGGGKKNNTEINAYINLFMYAQQFYGLKSEQDFSLFVSDAPYTDVIFQDATHTLQVVPEEERNYRDYLGPRFLRARAIVDCKAGANEITFSLSILSICLSFFMF